MLKLISNTENWRILAKVAETGSLSRAALELGCEVSRVSRIMIALEKEVGMEILDRSKRPLKPTRAGAELLERLRPALAEWEAFEAFLDSSEAPVTVIRLSTPIGIGRFYLNNELREYSAIEPAVIFDTSVDQGAEAVLAGEVDVAFVPFRPLHPGLKVLPAMDAFTMPLASTAYVRKFGAPEKPEDLRRHVGLLKSGRDFPMAARLVRRGESAAVLWKRVIRYSDMLNIKDAVLKGFGVSLDLPLGMVLEEISHGEIVPVLGGWHRDFWHYSVITQSSAGEDSVVARFAQWFVVRATREIDERRERGFRLLGIDPRSI